MECEMNIELLERTAKWLEAGAPERNFNMAVVVDWNAGWADSVPANWCGTTCCIGGYIWQQTIAADDTRKINRALREGGICHDAADAAGLDRSVADALFYPKSTSSGLTYEGGWSTITPAQAARAVRNVMERGEPYWEEILDFEEETK